MKKTQGIAKTTFKGLIDLEKERLPQKKSRSRSIRDRNNTISNQFSVSRATQQQQSRITQQQTRVRQTTWTAGGNNNSNNYNTKNNRRKVSQEGIVKFDDNISSNLSKQSRNNESRNESRNNESRNQSSIEKIKENMRKQSQQLKQKIRDRSHSRRRRNNSGNNSQTSNNNNTNNSREKQHSREHHTNKLSVPKYQQPHKNTQNEYKFFSQGQQKQTFNQIINMKNKLNALQYHYGTFSKHMLTQSFNKQNYQLNGMNNDSLSRVGLAMRKQDELKEKAQDLNNILETFHITFKQNISQNYTQINGKIDNYHRTISKNGASSINNPHHTSIQPINSVNQNINDTQSNSLISIIHKLQTQFCIQQHHASHNKKTQPTNRQIPSSHSLFTQINKNKKVAFSDLQKRLLLAEERLLK